MSVSSLVLSTLAVQQAADWGARQHVGHVERTAIIVSSNMLSFAALWLVQFIILDRVLFGRTSTTSRNTVHSKPPDNDEETVISRDDDPRYDSSAVGVGR
jgi:hypothetical protein